ncbi:MAG: nuclear transport factor 2 family protein [Gammaproteobacteria bacterium]|nr:nuclear transport factor 2 family protein [Gammaproteobacteria bacterium]MCP5199860.1 nuclear transport factor 2 family protein [Gammaproteobacteria bacterium]
MGIAENKALVTRFWEAFSAGRIDEVLDMLADDATWWVGGSTALSGTYTKPAFAELLGQVTGMMPEGVRVTPTQLTAEDDRVSVEAESYGPVNNGRVYQNVYHFMMVIRDGKIAAVREYLDTEHVTATFAP